MSFFYDISEPSEEQQGLTFSDFVATNSFFQPLATARGLNTTYQSLVLAGETSLGTDGVELEARVAFARAGLVFNYSLEQALLPADFLLSNELGGPGFCQSKEEDAVAFSFDFAGQPFDMPEGPSLPNDASKAQELQKLAFEFQEMSVVEEGYEPSPGDQDTSILPVSFSGPPTSEEESKHTTGPGVSLEFIESFDFDLIDSSSTRSLKPKKPMPPNSLKNTRGVPARTEFILTSDETGDDTDGHGCNFEPYELRLNPPSTQYAEPTTIPRKLQHDVRTLLKQAVQLAELDDEPDHTPKHRSRELVELQRDIRAHAKRLLKIGAIDHSTGQPHEIELLDPQESQRFEADKKSGNGPSLDRFIIDMVSTKSKWNKRLAAVFSEDFIACGFYPCHPKQTTQIAKMFLVHIKTIRREIMEARDNEIDQLDKAKAAAREMRRRNLMNRRRRACEAYASDSSMLACHELLRRLPYTVCSGDESSHEGAKTRYAVTSMEWRNEKLHFIFRVLDRIYMSTRFTDANRATQGMFPHVRLPSKRKDNRGPPAGLPQNFYSSTFLEKLEDYELHALAIKPAVSLQFSDSMIR
ncbi:hypothetical protein CPB83DRAFT_900278 [Crepidotus variabilis]|uniref:Uncharacterized protein n=1 Tax=Crepidotus variabilis TaxID=179855 RepID=A0A9P6E3E8_9AGAR|nr:hypothetical protein CPB83DRAFT_900278 [Crepidotus variabilis]